MSRQQQQTDRLQRDADRARAIANPKSLTGTIVAAVGALPSGYVQVRLQDGAIVAAISLSDRGYPDGVQLRITNQGGKYYAAGPVRSDR